MKFVHRYISELLLCEWKILLTDFFDILSSLHAGKLKKLKDEHTTRLDEIIIAERLSARISRRVCIYVSMCHA